MRAVFIFAAALTLGSAAWGDSGSGEAPRARYGPIAAIHAKPLSALGNDAIRFSTSPALGGTATVVEIRPDKNAHYRVTVTYLEGHPSLGWDKWGSFKFWISADDFRWLLGKVEAAERELGSEDGGPNKDGDIVVCTVGPGYLSEIRSKGSTRWISGFCGRNANNSIAPLMARLVQHGTSIFLRNMDRNSIVKLRDDLPDKALAE